MAISNRLRQAVLAAETENRLPDMRVLVDAASQKMAQKLYVTHISEDDFRRLPQFLHALDSLLVEFGAGAAPDAEEEAVRRDVDK